MLQTVRKRNGQQVPYDRDKITQAVKRCFLNQCHLEDEPAQAQATHVAEQVEQLLQNKQLADITVEQIQDLVETVLMLCGYHKAAREYVLYRERHAELRAQRPIPAEVQQKFDEAARYFTGSNKQTQLLQAYDKFARFNQELGRREVWPETVDRVLNFFQRHMDTNYPAAVEGEVWNELRQSLLHLETSPSMRCVQMGGPALERCHMGVFNCLGEQTEFVTSHGVRTFGDFSPGDEITVLGHSGQWRKATVRCYGRQQLYRYTFARGRTRLSVLATANHRWLLDSPLHETHRVKKTGKQAVTASATRGLSLLEPDQSLHGFWETTELQIGDRLAKSPMPFEAWQYETADPLERLYWAYGYVYGDGTLTTNRENGTTYSMVRLCGDKAGRYLHRFEELGFTSSSPLSCQGDPMVYTGKYQKTLPCLVQDGVAMVRAFVRGYLDADGAKNPEGCGRNQFRSIQVTGEAGINFVREVFPVVGVYILREEDMTGQVTNLGVRHQQTVRFGLLTAVGDGHNGFYSCVEQEPASESTVWCLEVDADHSFVLANGLLTGNCAYQEMDGPQAMAEQLYVLMQGTGGGFSVEGRVVDRWPRVQRQRPTSPLRYVIDDTTESWCDSLKFGVEHWLDGQDVEFDYSLIRPKGMTLKTKGGRASGPDPLRDLHQFVRSTILSRAGRRLEPLHIHDMTCMVHRIVQMGGVRRASGISLSDLQDASLRHCKDGAFWERHGYRNQANNSAVYEEKPSEVEFMREWLALAESGSGERGIFNRGSLRRQLPMRRQWVDDFGTNPCGEIILRPKGLCNLSIAVARPGISVTELEQRVRLATIWGTFQSTMTSFQYVSPRWQQNCEEERLLGVDILGHLDCELLRPHAAGREALLASLKQLTIDTNRIWAAKLGIRASAAVTCGKPSGDSSVFFDAAPGFKAYHGRYYIRRFRLGADNPIARLLQESGVPWHKDYDTSGNLVFDFPLQAPEGALLLEDQTAVGQLENWKTWKMHFTEHNPSVTVFIRNGEWLDAGRWVYENWDIVGGLSFFPYDDAVYPLAPYERIDTERYQQMMEDFPEIDWAKLTRYEDSDHTTLAGQFACSGDKCAF